MNFPSNMLKRVRDEVGLVDRHLDVLRMVMKHQPIGIMRLAEQMSIPYHRVRYSLRVLERMGYIRASYEGAIVLNKAHKLLCELNPELDEVITLLYTVREKNSHNV